jgi:selenocysteine lyase/cysteine desulfurase
MALWETYRDEFPVTRNLIYLNHAAVTPLPRRVAAAMIGQAEQTRDWGSQHYDQWLRAYEELRQQAARLMGASPREIAIVKNTSEGIATVAMGIGWRDGDVVVAFREEFPSNFYPWKRLEERGVTVRWLSIHDSLERIEEAARGARLLAVSFVNYLSGHRMDLTAIGAACRREGCLFLVDAIQGLGALELNVERDSIDFLAADGHKWLLGPEGCGVLYVRRGLQDEVEPVEFGWTNVAKFADYTSRDMTLRGDAGRYEPGTLNTIGIYGLRAALELINEIGVGEIEGAVRARARQIEDGVKAKGYEVLPTGSGIVTFRKEGVDTRVLMSKLRAAEVVAVPRHGYVRMSPHFYISPEAVERVLDVLE